YVHRMAGAEQALGEVAHFNGRTTEPMNEQEAQGTPNEANAMVEETHRILLADRPLRWRRPLHTLCLPARPTGAWSRLRSWRKVHTGGRASGSRQRASPWQGCSRRALTCRNPSAHRQLPRAPALVTTAHGSTCNWHC